MELQDKANLKKRFQQMLVDKENLKNKFRQMLQQEEQVKVDEELKEKIKQTRWSAKGVKDNGYRPTIDEFDKLFGDIKNKPE